MQQKEWQRATRLSYPLFRRTIPFIYAASPAFTSQTIHKDTSMAKSSTVLVISVILCLLATQAFSIQCYKCGCFTQDGSTTCPLNCTTQVLEDSFCYASRTSGDLELGHSPVSVVGITFPTAHYLRTIETIAYGQGAWQKPTVSEVSYGCNWDLCNGPKIMELLPTSLTLAIEPGYLSSLLIDTSSESPLSCKSCSKCITATSDPDCPAVSCPQGTCIIDDHADDPQFNGNCSATYMASCVQGVTDIMVRIRATFDMSKRVFQVNELDLNCRKTNCNDPTIAELLQKNVTYTEIDSTLFMRPNGAAMQTSHMAQATLLILAVAVRLLS